MQGASGLRSSFVMRRREEKRRCVFQTRTLRLLPGQSLSQLCRLRLGRCTPLCRCLGLALRNLCRGTRFFHCTCRLKSLFLVRGRHEERRSRLQPRGLTFRPFTRCALCFQCLFYTRLRLRCCAGLRLGCLKLRRESQSALMVRWREQK